jgi:hypothetical protein
MVEGVRQHDKESINDRFEGELRLSLETEKNGNNIKKSTWDFIDGQLIVTSVMTRFCSLLSHQEELSSTQTKGNVL